MTGKKVVAIVQARMGSERLPAKVLADIQGKPMLAWVAERTAEAQNLHALVVATTTEEADNVVEDMCAERGIEVFRGHPTDVLDRYFQAALVSQAEIIVRVTGDCPLIDPDLIDDVILAYLSADPVVAFAANRLPNQRTFPIGTDVEVCSFEALRTTWEQADQPHQREHVMPYLYEAPGRFQTLIVRNDRDLSGLRWAVDEQKDLEFVRRIYSRLGSEFTWLEVVELLEREPSILIMNAAVEQRGLGG